MNNLPWIGGQVIVSFLEGDPDRPIITGPVYSGANYPSLLLDGAGGGENKTGRVNKTKKPARGVVATNP